LRLEPELVEEMFDATAIAVADHGEQKCEEQLWRDESVAGKRARRGPKRLFRDFRKRVADDLIY